MAKNRKRKDLESLDESISLSEILKILSDKSEDAAGDAESEPVVVADPVASSQNYDELILSTDDSPASDHAAVPEIGTPIPIEAIGSESGFRTVPLLPLRSDVPFPQIIMPLIVGRDKGIRLIDDVLKADKIVGLVTQRDGDVEEPKLGDLYSTICVATVLKMLRFPDGSTRIIAQGNQRARLIEIVSSEPYLIASIDPISDVVEKSVEIEALTLTARRLFQRLVEGGGQASEDLQVAVMNTQDPSAVGDLLASGLPFTSDEKQELLTESNVRVRLKRLTEMLKHQVDMQELSSKIQGEVSNEITRVQREQFLRGQMQAIRRELGEGEEDGSELGEFNARLEKLKLPEAAAKECRRELDRMAQMHPSSPEFHVIRTFVDTLLSMPWHESSEDRLDIRRARKILDEDHYDLVKVKERILEHLSVRKLKKDMRGPILCFVGPPGVGKTSLGKSIARTMGRKFIRVSLGGVHDEAEIRGHRRTYIGAMPGRIIQGLRKLGVNNPVFMLDEIDKLGRDYRGDPSSALLEVLDPEQNYSFRDHYLDVEFDLSRILFICTANQLTTIPSPLLDRMEVLELSGYSEEEKLAIANRYLIPKQLTEHGLPKRSVLFPADGVRSIISSYTHEAGLRNLEREIASVCRKIARQHAEGNRGLTRVDAKKVHALLGPAKYIREKREGAMLPGTANGLAWTPTGGEILTIECIKALGQKHNLKLTGSLGDVMKESAHAALGYLSSHAEALGIERAFFEDFELHIHVPAGAISKDGPSAGVALTSSLLSLARNLPIRNGLAMTGEITLTGRVLAVGGIREKVLAARREGLTTVILPKQNDKDCEELPKEVQDDLTFIFVGHMDEVIPQLFAVAEPPVKRRKATPPAAGIMSQPAGL